MEEKIDIEVGEADRIRRISIRRREGGDPGFSWLGGFLSDMQGSKALALADWCEGRGFSSFRHDYSGHGESGGEFAQGTISRWLEESLAAFDLRAAGKSILVGSSMGGWIALRMAQELRRRGESERLCGMLLIAPAPDFTRDLFYAGLDEAQREALHRDGFLERESEYSDEPTLYTLGLCEDGERNFVLDSDLRFDFPVHILQGMEDADVPWRHALKLVERLDAPSVCMTLVKDGDHRLSRPQDIDLLLRIAESLAE